MPTTPPQNAGQAVSGHHAAQHAVTGVSSANSGHCTTIHSTIPTLWEPAALCANVPGTVLASVLPTPHTSSAVELSTSMGATLERGTDLDQNKTPS